MRIVQAGLGSWGRSWATVVAEAEGVALVAVADPAPAAREWAVEGLGLEPGRCFTSVAEAVAATGCEAVLVATPPATHRAVAGAALGAGKHVLVEKPLALELTEARAMVAAARGAGRVLMVAQNYRHRREARLLRRLVGEGAVGELVAVRVAFRREVRPFLPVGDYRWGMRHPLLFEMGIHHLDLLRTIAGRDVTEVYARSWPVPGGGFVHDPAVSAVLTLEGGVVVAYEGALTPYGPETSWNGEWELLGEGGRLRWTGDPADAIGGEVTLEMVGGPAKRLPVPEPAVEDRAAVLDAFRVAAASGEEPETGGADNLRSLAAVLGCARSIETGKVVRVADLLDEAPTATRRG